AGIDPSLNRHQRVGGPGEGLRVGYQRLVGSGEGASVGHGQADGQLQPDVGHGQADGQLQPDVGHGQADGQLQPDVGHGQADDPAPHACQLPPGGRAEADLEQNRVLQPEIAASDGPD